MKSWALGTARRGLDPRQVRRAFAVGDVVGDAAVGQEGILRDVTDELAQRGRIERDDVFAVQPDAAAGRGR